jgi:multidrug resistance efflux pump
MAETEVESILREIRERVLSEQRTGKDRSAIRSTMTNGANGAGDSKALPQITNDDNETLTAENLSLIESYLTTTARAWDRLPPLVSNRSGFIARVELWLKRQLKRATHWFTWEQVNFNAAVHQALRELLPLMAAQEHQLQGLKAQLAAQLAANLAAAETQLTELDALNTKTETRIDGLVNELRGLVSELNERDAHLRDEQRVCFKQLALETSEAAVLEDRARRKNETLLEELQRRVDRLEKKG